MDTTPSMDHIRTQVVYPGTIKALTVSEYLNEEALNLLMFYLLRNKEKTQSFLAWQCQIFKYLLEISAAAKEIRRKITMI